MHHFIEISITEFLVQIQAEQFSFDSHLLSFSAQNFTKTVAFKSKRALIGLSDYAYKGIISVCR